MTDLFKKLNYKLPFKVYVMNVPDSFNNEIVEMRKFTEVTKEVNSKASIDFIILFVKTQKEIEYSIEEIFQKLAGDAILWYCYPKATSKKYKCEFNRDNGWDVLGKYNLEGVRQVAIDEDWSALRFRKTEFIKKLTRNPKIAISEEGKKRTTKI